MLKTFAKLKTLGRKSKGKRSVEDIRKNVYLLLIKALNLGQFYYYFLEGVSPFIYSGAERSPFDSIVMSC